MWFDAIDHHDREASGTAPAIVIEGVAHVAVRALLTSPLYDYLAGPVFSFGFRGSQEPSHGHLRRLFCDRISTRPAALAPNPRSDSRLEELGANILVSPELGARASDLHGGGGVREQPRRLCAGAVDVPLVFARHASNPELSDLQPAWRNIKTLADVLMAELPDGAKLAMLGRSGAL
jgi:hypothetical protein